MSLRDPRSLSRSPFSVNLMEQHLRSSPRKTLRRLVGEKTSVHLLISGLILKDHVAGRVDERIMRPPPKYLTQEEFLSRRDFLTPKDQEMLPEIGTEMEPIFYQKLKRIKLL
jgi:hypothetical protein